MCRGYCLIIAALLLLPLCMIAVENVFPLDDDYVRPWELLPEIREIVEINPEIASWQIIGTSGTDRLPIYAIKVSDHVTLSETYNPKLLFVGSHQSEEVIGIEVVLNNARKLIESYGIDPFLTELIDCYELWFVPTADPEGFNLVNGGKVQYKRKNNTDTDWDGIFEPLEDGVDLNKNYPFNWEMGESTWKRSRYYKGESPASEPEVQAMMQLYDTYRFEAAIFYHSSALGTYSERVFFPWRWNDDLSPDYVGMYRLARDVASELPKDFEDGRYTVHTWNNFQNGYARDYIYSSFHTWALTIESGGDSPYGYGIIQPPNSLLQKHLESHWKAFLAFVRHVHDSTIILRFTDKHDEPYRDLPIMIAERSHPLMQPMRTNRDGYIIRMLEPGNFTLDAGGTELHLTKKAGYSYEEFAIDAPRREQNPLVYNALQLCKVDPSSAFNELDTYEFHPGTCLRLTAKPDKSIRAINIQLHGNQRDYPIRLKFKVFAGLHRAYDQVVDYNGGILRIPLDKRTRIENLSVIIEQLDIKSYQLYKWQHGMSWEQAVRFSHWQELEGRAIGVQVTYE